MKSSLLGIVILSLSLTTITAQSNSKNLTLEYFQKHLNKEMNYDSLIDIFGKSNQDIGSGIFINEYILTDSTRILIGYSDRLLYARHVNEDYQLISVLIDN